MRLFVVERRKRKKSSRYGTAYSRTAHSLLCLMNSMCAYAARITSAPWPRSSFRRHWTHPSRLRSLDLRSFLCLTERSNTGSSSFAGTMTFHRHYRHIVCMYVCMYVCIHSRNVMKWFLYWRCAVTLSDRQCTYYRTNRYIVLFFTEHRRHQIYHQDLKFIYVLDTSFLVLFFSIKTIGR